MRVGIEEQSVKRPRGSVVRVKITPERMERLARGETLRYKFPPAVAGGEVEVVLEQGDDVFAQFDRIFNKVSKKILDKVEKATNAILK
jgi:hypothetical protein